MATPTIVATGTTTAANSPGVSKEYVNLETLTFTDPANPAPTTALWELIDAPPGQTSVILNPTTTTPTLVLDSDFGTFRVRHTADGDVGELLFAVLTTGVITERIPGYLEQNDARAIAPEGTWNKGGNVKGWFDDFHSLLKSTMTAIIIDHGGLTGLADDDHTQYLLTAGTRASTGAQTFSDGLIMGGNKVSDNLVSTDAVSTSDAALATAGYVDARYHRDTVDHGGIGGLTDDDHTQYLRTDGTRASTGAQTFSSGVVIGGNTASDIIKSTDSASTSDTALVTAGYVDAGTHGDRQITFMAHMSDGMSSGGTIHTVSETVASDWYGRFKTVGIGDVCTIPFQLPAGSRIKQIYYWYYGASTATKRFSMMGKPQETNFQPTIYETNTAGSSGHTSYTQTVSPQITVAAGDTFWGQYRSGAASDRFYYITVTYDHP